MSILLVTLLTPTLILSIPVDKFSIVGNKSASVPGPNAAKPFMSSGWKAFPLTSDHEIQSKIDEGLSGIITEVGSVMTAMSNIFDIFGPTKKINTKSYGNSPGADEVEFIAPKDKGETTTEKEITETVIDGEETTVTEPPMMESMSDRRSNL